MSDTILLVEKQDGIATLTLNRPQAMNALSRELRTLMVQMFDQLQNDLDTRVVILTGAGERAFCAGLDLKELGSADTSLNRDVTPGNELDVVEALGRFDRPIIGAINGVAITGGFELALACDVLIASAKGRFADTHARVGVMPGWGLSQKLSRVIGIYRAKELSLTGNFLSAEQAEHWGLVNPGGGARRAAPDLSGARHRHVILRPRHAAKNETDDECRLCSNPRRRPHYRSQRMAGASPPSHSRCYCLPTGRHSKTRPHAKLTRSAPPSRLGSRKLRVRVLR